MKKPFTAFFSILLFLIPLINYAQTRKFFQFELKNQRYPTKSEPEILSVLDNDIAGALTFTDPKGAQKMIPKSSILLGIQFKPEESRISRFNVNSMDKVYSGYFLSNGAEVTVLALGINAQNVNDYQYRVVENDSIETIPWSKIPKLEQNYGAKKAYGFIGKFKAPGKRIFLEVRNKKDYKTRDGIVFDWRGNFKPLLKQVNLFVKVRDTLFATVLKEDEFKLGLTKSVDPKTNVPIGFKFKDGVVSVITLYFNNPENVPFDVSISRKKEGDTAQNWGVEFNMVDDHVDIHSSAYNSPGKYEAIIRPSESTGKVQEKNILRIPFEVLPGKDRSQSPPVGLIILLSLIVILIGALIFVIYYTRSTRRLQKSKQEQQVTTLKLKSIRSQLNPHFMFNALTSIQNLINKNNISDANFYLSKFAGLTRQVLDSNNENFLSLEDEIKMLTDYLQMEQLRFDFQYQINIDSGLNQANIEVPAMLLQPFVENAVKHGVSGLKHNGMVEISFKAVGPNLEMSVADNGSGYKQDTPSSGYGIKLSEERVELLNQLYKDQSISLTINSTSSGTIIMVSLSNWIS